MFIPVLYMLFLVLLLLFTVLLYFHVELPHENETNGYIFIHAEGGLNQQRIAVWDMFFHCDILYLRLFFFTEIDLERDILLFACFFFHSHWLENFLPIVNYMWT